MDMFSKKNQVIRNPRFFINNCGPKVLNECFFSECILFSLYIRQIMLNMVTRVLFSIIEEVAVLIP